MWVICWLFLLPSNITYQFEHVSCLLNIEDPICIYNIASPSVFREKVSGMLGICNEWRIICELLSIHTSLILNAYRYYTQSKRISHRSVNTTREIRPSHYIMSVRFIGRDFLSSRRDLNMYPKNSVYIWISMYNKINYWNYYARNDYLPLYVQMILNK